MIICHAVTMPAAHHSGYEQEFLYHIAYDFFGDYPGVAHAFMFAMGVGVIFSRKNGPADLMIRGVKIYILGFILNFFRYGIYALIDGLIEGEFMDETVLALVVQDIFHFAGLALIATGVFKLFRLSETHIFIIGVVLSAIGGVLAFRYQGSYAADYFIGHFIVTTEECSCFAFMNWYFFVAAGILFGSIIRKVSDQDRFYRRLFCIACPVMIIYVVMTFLFGVHFLTKNGLYYATSLPESIGLLSIDLTLMCIFFFLLKKVDNSRLSVFFTMSRNVTEIYCIQWCVIGFVDSIFCYLMGIEFSYPAMYSFGIVLIFLSYYIAKWCSKRNVSIPI